MKSANATSGRARPKQPHEARRPSESHTRLPDAAAPRVGTEVKQGRWATCEESTPPEVPVAERRRSEPSPDEPRTGVVRRMNVATSERQSGVIRRTTGRAESAGKLRSDATHESRSAGTPADWRCLEWDRAPKERRPKRNSKVTIVQLSSSGDLVRQNGPDEWLPQAGDFVHRMSRLVAQGLGFNRCHSVCLRSSSAALTIAEAGDAKVMVVSGPLASMSRVLRRAGLE